MFVVKKYKEQMLQLHYNPPPPKKKTPKQRSGKSCPQVSMKILLMLEISAIKQTDRKQTAFWVDCATVVLYKVLMRVEWIIVQNTFEKLE